MGTHWMIFRTIGNLVSSSSFPLRRTSGGADRPAPSERKDLPVLGCYGNGDLVEGRVCNLIGFNLGSTLGSTLNHSRQDLCHFWIRSAVVSFRVLCCVPEADSERFLPALSNERDFVLESFLFSKQGEDVLLKRLGKLRNAIGLQMHGNSACKHVTLLGGLCQGGDSDNLHWFRRPEDSLSTLTNIG